MQFHFAIHQRIVSVTVCLRFEGCMWAWHGRIVHHVRMFELMAMFWFRVSPAHSVIRLHVEIRVTDTEAMATRELHQVLSNFVHFSSSEMIQTVKPRVHWSRWVRKVVLSLGYFRWWCSGHHRTCLWSQARRSACVRKHWWGWLNEGVETRRFLLSVLGGTIRPS